VVDVDVKIYSEERKGEAETLAGFILKSRNFSQGTKISFQIVYFTVEVVDKSESK
jgi:hypothetical protein